MKRIKMTMLLFATCIVVYFSATWLEVKSFSQKNEQEEALFQEALQIGRLAALPSHAANVRAAGTGNRFSTTIYGQFSTSPEQIDQFIVDSESLRNVSPVPIETLLNLPPDFKATASKGEGTLSRTEEKGSFEIPVKGRKYVIPQDHKAGYGEVVIDEASHFVFIKVSRS